MKKHLVIIGTFALILTGCTNSPAINTSEDDSLEPLQFENNPINNEVVADESKSTNTITGIQAGDLLESPVLIEGLTSAESGKLIVELRDENHDAKVNAFAIIEPSEDGMKKFRVRLNFLFKNTEEGFLAVYEKDGEEISNLIEIPVKYNTIK